jgi:hypothetical protein
MKKVLSLILPVVLMAGLLSGCIFDNNLTVSASNGFVSIDINPSVQLILNEEDEVIGVSASNDDGETILLGEVEELIGLSVEEATQRIVELAIEYGFLDPEALETDPSAVTITTVIENESVELEQRLRNKVKTHLQNFFKNNGIFSVVMTEDNMTDILAEADEMGVSLGHLKVIKSVQATHEDYTLEQLLQMDMPELMGMLREHSGIEHHISNREESLTEIQTIIDNLVIDIDNLTTLLVDDQATLVILEAMNIELMDEAALASHNFTIDELETAIDGYIADLADLNIDLDELNDELEYKTRLQSREQKRQEALNKYQAWEQNKETRAENTRARWDQFQENLTEAQMNALVEYAENHFGIDMGTSSFS